MTTQEPTPDKRPEESSSETTSINPLLIESQIIEALRMCFDPEIPVNVYELGLIYGINVDPAGNVVIQMTLTSPHCPMAGSIAAGIEHKVKEVPGVKNVRIEIVWDPPWNPSRMSEAAKLQLGMV